MANQLLKCGDIVLVNLPSHRPKGHEQEGKRPVIVIGVPVGVVRYPVVIVIPLTTQIGDWATQNAKLYPIIEAGTAGLPKKSVVLCDQLRAVDIQRVVAYLGGLSVVEYQPIINGLRQVLALQS